MKWSWLVGVAVLAAAVAVWAVFGEHHVEGFVRGVLFGRSG